MSDITALVTGELSVAEQLREGRNAVFRGRVHSDEGEHTVVYKPVRGERPLWDFPTGTLASREVAAFLLDTAASWGVVPATVLRDGPLGLGSVQRWVYAERRELVRVFDAERVPEGWLPVLQAEDEQSRPLIVAHVDTPALRRVALFDAVVNNTDRKATHLLPDRSVVRGIDHGLTFSVEDKLRSVLWGWGGQKLSEEEIAVVELTGKQLEDAALAAELERHITVDEIVATQSRVERLLTTAAFPLPQSDWPAVPWPLGL